jgi:zinc transporter 7
VEGGKASGVEGEGKDGVRQRKGKKGGEVEGVVEVREKEVNTSVKLGGVLNMMWVDFAFC